MGWVLVDVAPKSKAAAPRARSVSDGPGSGFRPRAVVLFRIDDLIVHVLTSGCFLFVFAAWIGKK
jgi:hypothetical protein